jgi:hypothetical protein
LVRAAISSAAKDERITALESNDAAIGAGMLDHEGIDFVLRDCLRAAALANIENFGAWRRKLENCLRDQVVVEDDVGCLDET